MMENTTVHTINIFAYFKLFLHAGVDNNAPDGLIHRLQKLWEKVNEDVVWKAPEVLEDYAVKTKYKLASVIMETGRDGEKWYEEMKRVFETYRVA